jgi:hypothetical protein
MATTTETGPALQDGDIVCPVYASRDVSIPPGFLVGTPPDALPIVARVIWRETDLPENKGCYAAVLDYVLSPSECDALVQKTASPTAAGPAHDRGAPALVNIGGGLGTATALSRTSRISWTGSGPGAQPWTGCRRG